MGRCCIFLPVVAAMMATAWARGSGNGPLAEMGTADSSSDWPFQVTRTVTGDVLWVKKDGDISLIVVQDDRGKRAVFTVNQKTRFKADKKTEYAGRKHVTPDDLAVGQRVAITFVGNSGEVLALRFMANAKPKKSGAWIGAPSAAPVPGSPS